MMDLSRVVVACVACIGLSACGASETSPAPSPEEPAGQAPAAPAEEPAAPAEEVETWGEALDPGARSVDLGAILADPEAYKDQTLATEGVVRAVCQKRGCWMELRTEAEREGETLRTTFKDYAFFMPKDSRGAKVKVEGRLSVDLLSAEQVAHLEAEGATITKRADGSAVVPTFTASGVEMRGRKK